MSKKINVTIQFYPGESHRGCDNTNKSCTCAKITELRNKFSKIDFQTQTTSAKVRSILAGNICRKEARGGTILNKDCALKSQS